MKRLFYEARNVLLKVDALNINDVRLKSIREKIEDGVSELESQVKDMINAYDAAYRAKDYQQCLRLCNELLSMGADSSIWTKKRQELKEKINQEQLFQDNYELARKARLNNDWNAVVDYAQKALAIKEDADIKAIMQEANSKLAEIRKKKQFEDIINDIVELINKKKNDEAESKLNNLERALKRDGFIDADMEKQMKNIRKMLFNFGPSVPSTPDDFFDIDHSKVSGQINLEESKAKISNDDFNFNNK